MVEAPGRTCQMNCTSRAVKSIFSTNPCSFHASCNFIAQFLDGSGCEAATYNVELENTRTFILTNVAAGYRSNVILDHRNGFPSCRICILYASLRSINIFTCCCTDCFKSFVHGKALIHRLLFHSLSRNSDVSSSERSAVMQATPVSNASYRLP